MHRFVTILVLGLLWGFTHPVTLLAQPSVSIGAGPAMTPIYPEFTVAQLPADPPTGTVAIVTDAATAGRCTAGSGTFNAHCRWDGAAWAPIGVAADQATTFTAGLSVVSDNDTAQLLVEDTGSAGQDLLVLRNAGPSRFLLTNTASAGSADWRFNHANDGAFRIAADDGDVEFALGQDGNLIVDRSVSLPEQASAPTGVAGRAIIFAQDNGAGKTQLMVQFGTGAAQQLAIEP